MEHLKNIKVEIPEGYTPTTLELVVLKKKSFLKIGLIEKTFQELIVELSKKIKNGNK